MQNKLKKQLVITLVAHQSYTRCMQKNIPVIWQNILFPAITDTYIPLLRMMENLSKDGIRFSLSLVLSPTLCALLDDPLVQEEYNLWLERLIVLGEREIEREKGTPAVLSLARSYVKQLEQTKNFFADVCGGLLLPRFADFASEGCIEFLATAASFCFLPHYRKLGEAVDAQIETGIVSQRNYFGSIPKGFWLPSMGYTAGLEKNIRKYGFLYTVLDTHGFLFSDPLPQNGIFSPACCHNSLAVFGRDPKAQAQVGSFMKNKVYRDQNRDIGFDFPLGDLQPLLHRQKERCVTGFKYWAQKDKKTVYNAGAAGKQAFVDAETFLNAKTALLSQASCELESRPVSLICAFDARDFGQNWYEGVYWLEQVFRQAAARNDIECSSYSRILTGQSELQKLSPFMSASEGSGYAENLLDKSNSWMLRYSLKAAERMVDLAERFSADSGLKERCLNLAAKQVLIAQSSDWPRMLHEGIKSDYACEIFKYSIQGFSAVYDSLGSSSVSTEWLTRTEKDYPLFPWMNYRIFAKKH